MYDLIVTHMENRFSYKRAINNKSHYDGFVYQKSILIDVANCMIGADISLDRTNKELVLAIVNEDWVSVSKLEKSITYIFYIDFIALVKDTIEWRVYNRGKKISNLLDD